MTNLEVLNEMVHNGYHLFGEEPAHFLNRLGLKADGVGDMDDSREMFKAYIGADNWKAN